MANPYFNATYYLANNPDLFAAGINTVEGAWAHYVQFGAAEALQGAASRSPAPWFDIAYYLKSNSDLATAGLTAGQLFEHFINFGIEEGRQPSADANVNSASLAAYAAANADLREAFGIEEGAELTPAQELALAQHFYAFGYAEPREGKPAEYEPEDPNTGETFTLTTAIENVVGTSGDDTISGVIDGATTTTFQLGDTVDGGAGRDTLNLTVATNPAGAARGDVKNVEVINIRDLAGSTVSAAQIVGAEEIWSSKSTNNLTVTGIQNNVALGLQETESNLAATFKDGVFKAGSTLNISVNGAGKSSAASTITAGHAATAGTATDLTLALTAAGGKSYIEYVNGLQKVGDLKTITVAGEGFVSLTDGAGTEFDNVTTIDASKNSGGVTVSVGANNKDLTVTGGSGDDKFVLNNFNGTDKVDGGAGKDTLSISLANAVAFTKAAQVSNVEVLEVTGNTSAATTLNADYFGVSNFVVDGVIGHALTLTNLANNATVQLNSNSSAAADLTIDIKGAVAGTDDVLTLTTDKNGADLAANAVTVKAGGVETLNVVTSSETGAGAFKLGGITDAQLTTINISGKGDVDLGTIAAAGVTTVDASKAEGAVTADLTNSTKAVTFTGGSAIDTFTASAKGDTIYGGKGGDLITLGAGNDILLYKAASDSTATAKDVVTGFSITSDLIKFDASLLTGTATYLGSANFSNTGSTQLRMDTNDLQVDLNGDGTADMVITLTGVTAADFGAANFVFA